VAVLLVILGLAGCGYSHKMLFPEDVTTVAVPIFQNQTFYRGVEFDLSEALTKEIELRTPYKVIGRSAADTELTGKVVDVRQNLVSRTRPGALPQEVEVTVVVDFEWRNLKTGNVLRDRKGFSAVGRFRPTQPVGEYYERAQHEAVMEMATAIVAALQKDW
jgi:hypothetical protein